MKLNKSIIALLLLCYCSENELSNSSNSTNSTNNVYINADELITTILDLGNVTKLFSNNNINYYQCVDGTTNTEYIFFITK